MAAQPLELEPTDPNVAIALEVMGLVGSRPLCDALHAGHNDAIQCTDNDVATKSGFLRYSTPLRFLGDYYKPLGFRRHRDQNFEVLVSPDESYCITVAPGDSATGTERMPCTRLDRGPLTGQAVGHNVAQMSFDSKVSPLFSRPESSEMQLYHLLWFFDEDAEALRSELSVPVEFTRPKRDSKRGVVTRYEPRLRLPAILLGAIAQHEDESDAPLDIPVKRR